MCMCRGIRPRCYEGFVRVVQPHLRPLGAGEVLDRAVTLFVQRFFPLVLTLAVAVIPIAVVSYLVHPPDAANAWRDMIHPAPAPAPAGHEMDVLRQFLQRYVTPSSVLVVLASVIALTIANTACVIVAVAGYRGEAASISQAFRLSASRVVAQVISATLFAGLFLALVIGMVLVSIPITGIIAALIAVSNGVGLVIGVVIGLIMVLTLFAFI